MRRAHAEMVTTQSVQIGGRPPPKRPVYRSEFVIRLQTMREKRGKNFHFDLLDEPIDWRTPTVPVRTKFSTVRASSVNARITSKSYLPKTMSKTNLYPLSTPTPPKRSSAVIFNEFVDIYEIDDYDRKVDKSWTRLTQIEKLKIRCELNDFKTSEMVIHRDSRQHTRLHRI